MNNLIPTFTDITSWQKQNYVNTGGTRAKFVSLNQIGDVYYFKGSKETLEGDVRYPLEFWSEILSSKIGQLLGFNMLDYNIGYDSNHKQKIGCLSKSMIDEKHERLTEGINYLKGFSPDYQPETDKKKYTFQFINEALKHHNIDSHLPHLIDIIIFDSIIGNSDRHQENWGFIRKYIELTIIESKKKISESVEKNNNFFDKIKHWFADKNKEVIKVSTEVKPIKKEFINPRSSVFSPIYDSGCCLAREKSDEEIIRMNQDDQLIERYVNKGKSEIHWEENKITHLQLIKNLLESHEEAIKSRLSQIKEKYNRDDITSLVSNIDQSLPDFCCEYKIKKERKEVIIKIVNLRIDKLLSIL
ncbi:hypothetical protein M2T28_03800 [Elizabethkingia miricola]|uniref:hypothetical protein n=1 Tax=Elizabethkingia miricola TaxID=172045 RepID=UPI002018648E|nr:hypothetical protein [Elizabethkingia miricola]MDV3460251.1 hypothetical protein [Elizabethkingia anophelis]MCL1651719.1 hypothetical protein [Elizabethkingia miricola]MDV3777114.1 hypothetical protein [Elizabethkingia anophelis]MDV3788675.1 hypothetical protein [Elizabethkingia anophelis]MDV3841543.1 hypothetical protein [Elizabethkingia anophelis]